MIDSYPYVGFLDTTRWLPGPKKSNLRNGASSDQSMIKCFYYEFNQLQAITPHFNEEIEITVINFGPYDNGHIIIGLNTGAILILNSLDLSSMFRL